MQWVPEVPWPKVGLRPPRTLRSLGPLRRPAAFWSFRRRWPGGGGCASDPPSSQHNVILRRLEPPLTPPCLIKISFHQGGHQYLVRLNFDVSLKFEPPNAQLRWGSQIRPKMNTPADPPDPVNGVRFRTYWPPALESGLRQF